MRGRGLRMRSGRLNVVEGTRRHVALRRGRRAKVSVVDDIARQLERLQPYQTARFPMRDGADTIAVTRDPERGYKVYGPGQPVTGFPLEIADTAWSAAATVVALGGLPQPT
jgi:hypothetical protein